jgi:hypothetical protein
VGNDAMIKVLETAGAAILFKTLRAEERSLSSRRGVVWKQEKKDTQGLGFSIVTLRVQLQFSLHTF